MAEILPLALAERADAGGKARGLARLLRLGMAVPDGVVLLGASGSGDLRALLADHVREGVRYAVRSSALDEDGASHSFAGQFHTALHCEGLQGVLDGIRACLASADAARVGAYAAQLAEGADTSLAVIIQRMVPAAQAGVLFTADPASGRRDRWALSLVDGLGEALVSGEADGRRGVLNRLGALLAGESLPPPLHEELVRGARLLMDDMDGPVDIEFAVDDGGRLWWLQARPVTALPDVHPNELDDVVEAPGAVYTTANISEMMPGPVTPLTATVFGRAIDRGMQDYFRRVGAQGPIVDEPLFIHVSHQHLFIRLDAIYGTARACLGASKKDVDLAVVGRHVPEAKLGEVLPWPRRLWNATKVIRYLRQVPARMQALQRMATTYELSDDGTVQGLYRALGVARDDLCTAYGHHYASSVASGTWLGVLSGAISGRGSPPTGAQLGLVSTLLADIDGVESADAVKALEGLAERVASTSQAGPFTVMEPEVAWRWLHEGAGDDVTEAVRGFERRHGHRCLREAELRTASWAEDPAAWVALLQTRVRAGAVQRERTAVDVEGRIAHLPSSARRTIRFALPRARQGVADREFTKAHVILFQDHLKRGYRRLAERMVRAGLLTDPDLIFFHTHDELGAVVRGERDLTDVTRARRTQLDLLWQFTFPEICVGLPDPAHPAPPSLRDGQLRGVPVSRGQVQGRAVVAHHLTDAEALQPGDILVARTTDVGWSPWFAVAGGIVTEVGSPLSHGAVVAREYGIPAVVSVKGATAIPDGARILVDGDAGTVTVLSASRDASA